MACAQDSFDACTDDDLNVSGALGVLHETVMALGREEPVGADAAAALEFLRHCHEILGVIFVGESSGGDDLSEEQQGWIDQREQARKDKDWALADQLRDRLLESGIQIEDGAGGTTWSRVR